MLLRRVAHLGVDDAVLGEVLGALGGDPDQRVTGLHDADGVREGLQIALQGAGVGGLVEPEGELVGVGVGQVGVARLAGQVDDGAGAQSAVEVVVQQNLGRPADLVRGGGVRDGLARHFRTITPTRVDHPVRGNADTER